MISGRVGQLYDVPFRFGGSFHQRACSGIARLRIGRRERLRLRPVDRLSPVWTERHRGT